MSYFPEMQAAAAESQTILAQITGQAATATGNTLIGNATDPVLGVYGRPDVFFDPLPGGGYRKRTTRTLRITRARLPVPPAPNTKLTRIDLEPQIVYFVRHVDTQDALSWVLTVSNMAK